MLWCRLLAQFKPDHIGDPGDGGQQLIGIDLGGLCAGNFPGDRLARFMDAGRENGLHPGGAQLNQHACRLGLVLLGGDRGGDAVDTVGPGVARPTEYGVSGGEVLVREFDAVRVIQVDVD